MNIMCVSCLYFQIKCQFVISRNHAERFCLFWRLDLVKWTLSEHPKERQQRFLNIHVRVIYPHSRAGWSKFPDSWTLAQSPCCKDVSLSAPFGILIKMALKAKQTRYKQAVQHSICNTPFGQCGKLQSSPGPSRLLSGSCPSSVAMITSSNCRGSSWTRWQAAGLFKCWETLARWTLLLKRRTFGPKGDKNMSSRVTMIPYDHYKVSMALWYFT